MTDNEQDEKGRWFDVLKDRIRRVILAGELIPTDRKFIIQTVDETTGLYSPEESIDIYELVYEDDGFDQDDIEALAALNINESIHYDPGGSYVTRRA